MFSFRQQNPNRHEPKVYFRSDRQGRVWWDIYHPKTGLTTRVATEEEARLCIESENYY